MKVEIVDVCAARGHLMLVIDLSSKRLFKTVKERISVVCNTDGENIIRLDNYLQETRPVIKQIVKNFAHVYSITNKAMMGAAGFDMNKEYRRMMKSAQADFEAMKNKPMSLAEQKAYVGLNGDIIEPGK